MLKLKNVKKENECIEADYYPEGGDNGGHLVVDLIKREIADIQYAKDDLHKDGSVFGFYYPHAKKSLLRIADKGKVDREEYTIMWY